MATTLQTPRPRGKCRPPDEPFTVKHKYLGRLKNTFQTAFLYGNRLIGYTNL